MHKGWVAPLAGSLALFPPGTGGQWVELTPCGLLEPVEGVEVPAGPAPHLGPMFVRADMVLLVIGMKVPSSAKPSVACSIIAMGSGRIMYVIGTPAQVIHTLKEANE